MDPNDVLQESVASDETDLESLLQEGYGFTPLKRGEVREGTIVSVTSTEILIDLGSKTEGVVSGRELERMPRDQLSAIKVGDEVLAYVVNPEDKNGNTILSLTRAQLEKDWREAERLFETQEMFSGDVAGFNKGGLIVRLGRVRGFVPASQLATGRRRRSGEGQSPEERWRELTGQTLQLKVIEIDRERNRLILSERAAMREWRKAQKEKLLSELAEGEIRKGEVISLADFGAFVDLGGADGLIHLSELSWKRVNHPREVLNVGDEVEVYVLNVDRDRRRIGLSLKRLQTDPWETVEDKYVVDQLVEGVITKLAKFGAFAHIVGDEEIEGLIHISELSEGHIAHPKEVVKEGQVVTLRIIRIDTDQRRMGLSLKRVDQAEYADLDWQAELAASQAEEEQATADDEQAVPEAEALAEDVIETAETAADSEVTLDATEEEPVTDVVEQVNDTVAEAELETVAS
jgi:small subunit ribosomal protein S1